MPIDTSSPLWPTPVAVAAARVVAEVFARFDMQRRRASMPTVSKPADPNLSKAFGGVWNAG